MSDLITNALNRAEAALARRFGREQTPRPLPAPSSVMTVRIARAILDDTSCQLDTAVAAAEARMAKFHGAKPSSNCQCAVCNGYGWEERVGRVDNFWGCQTCGADAAWDHEQVRDAKAARAGLEATTAAARVTAKPTSQGLHGALTEALARLSEAQEDASAAKAAAESAASEYYDASNAVDEAKDARKRGDHDAPPREAIPVLVAEYEERLAAHQAAKAAETVATARAADLAQRVRKAGIDVTAADAGPAAVLTVLAGMRMVASGSRDLQWLASMGGRFEAQHLADVTRAWNTKPSDWVVPGGVPDSGLPAKLAELMSATTPPAKNGKGR